jgi:hypothetical protein
MSAVRKLNMNFGRLRHERSRENSVWASCMRGSRSVISLTLATRALTASRTNSSDPIGAPSRMMPGSDMSDMPQCLLRKQHNFLSGLRPATMIFHNKISHGGSTQQNFTTKFLPVDNHNDISQQNVSLWLTPTIFHNKIV